MPGYLRAVCRRRFRRHAAQHGAGRQGGAGRHRRDARPAVRALCRGPRRRRGFWRFLPPRRVAGIAAGAGAARRGSAVMLPISVDLGAVPGAAGRRRGGGAPPPRLARRGRRRDARNLRADPEPALAAMAGRAAAPPSAVAGRDRAGAARLCRRRSPIPTAADIRRVAKAAGVLVNVEDDRRRSDFHSAAVIRRGDLTVAISTNGKSPGLAALMRRVLEHRIGPEWELRLDEIAALRQAWRAAGADPAAIGRRTAGMGRPPRLARPGARPPLHRSSPARYLEPAANCLLEAGE